MEHDATNCNRPRTVEQLKEFSVKDPTRIAATKRTNERDKCGFPCKYHLGEGLDEMLQRCSCQYAGAVVTRPVDSISLRYESRYGLLRRLTLSKNFDRVSDENRFLSLNLLFHDQLGDAHVGRRQYRLSLPSFQKAVPLETPRAPTSFPARDMVKVLEEEGLDLHDLKQLSYHQLRSLLEDVLPWLSHGERAVFVTAVWDHKVCGVLRGSTDFKTGRHSESLCMRRGLEEHGWRCGHFGHTDGVYFENKEKVHPASITRTPHHFLSRQSSPNKDASSKIVDRFVDPADGGIVELRTPPNFEIVGRLEHEPNPRVWATPSNPMFEISVIGFEFLVHPQDIRVKPQIENAHDEWARHAAVVKQVLWEMVELYGVDSGLIQPLDMSPGELGFPTGHSDNLKAKDEVPTEKDSSAVSVEWLPPDAPLNDSAKELETSSTKLMLVDPQTQARIPWFRPPLPRRFNENMVPEILPFSPTFVIEATFRDSSTHKSQRFVPVLDIRLLMHPRSCVQWAQEEDEAKATRHVMEYAKKVPYALPFRLYLRVDPTRELRRTSQRSTMNPDCIRLEDEKEKRMSEKAHFFDLRNFSSSF